MDENAKGPQSRYCGAESYQPYLSVGGHAKIWEDYSRKNKQSFRFCGIKSMGRAATLEAEQADSNSSQHMKTKLQCLKSGVNYE